jgi:cytochrome c peroxidase
MSIGVYALPEGYRRFQVLLFAVFGALLVVLSGTAPAVSGVAVELVDEFKTPGVETELSGIYPHLTDDNLYYVVTNGRPTYRPTMKPMLPERLRNKLLTVNRNGEVVAVMDIPDGGGLFGDLKYGDGHLWLGPLDPPALWKLNLDSGQIVARYPLPGPAGGFEFDADRSVIYVQNYVGHPQLVVVDPSTGSVLDALWSDENCQGMAKVAGDLLTVWSSSWEADAYSELWVLDEVTGKPKERVRLEGLHAAMAPIRRAVAGFDGFMTLVHKASGDTGETVIRRYRYLPHGQRADTMDGRRADGVAAIQYSPTSSDPAQLRADLSMRVEEAARGGARYVVLPELAMSRLAEPTRGTTMVAPATMAEPIDGPTIKYFASLSHRLHLWMVVPLIEKAEDHVNYYITTVLLDTEGDVAATARKRVLRPDGSDGAALVGFARSLGETVDDRGRRIGIVSGDDLQSGVPRLAARGADTILVSANWSSDDKIPWESVASRLARQFNVNLVVANRQPGLGGIFSPEAPPVLQEPGNGAMVVANLKMIAPMGRVQSSLGLPSVPLPADQPFSDQLVELGRSLFFDKRLSITGTVACATCHKPEQFFADGRARGEGVYGRTTRRNVPSLLNAAFRTTLQWDGNPTTIEQQLKYPLTGFAELNMQSYEALNAVIRSDPGYVKAFRSVFLLEPRDVAREQVAIAVGAYIRTLVSANSAFDRYYYGGQKNVLSVSAVRGLQLFTGIAGCADCHRIDKKHALFMDSRFHNLGIGYEAATKSYRDPGVGTVSNSDYAGMFMTPSLRNVADTAPYMHDGSIPTIEQAIHAHFPAAPSGAATREDAFVPTDGEIQDLVSFLKTLSGEDRYSLDGKRLSGDVHAQLSSEGVPRR